MRSAFRSAAFLAFACGCNLGVTGACHRYVAEYNACYADMEGSTPSAPLSSLAANEVCAVYSYIAGADAKASVKANYDCLADAYRTADCTDEASLKETLRDEPCDFESDE